MVDFGGWDMPVQYSGIIEEHNTVRSAVGIFDVSHMGEIDIRGPQAADLTDFVTTNAVRKLKTGQIHYSGLLYDHGGFVDDILVHKVADDHYFLCVNAGNQEKDFEHIVAQNRFEAEVEFSSERYAQIAIQGPRAKDTVQKLTPVDLSAIKYYWFADGDACGIPARIAHTGYTGEDGFELYVAPEHAPRLMQKIIDAGAKPCGLGARDTLRLEAKMALYGNDIDHTTTPIEADLEWIVKLEKGDFAGRDVLDREKSEGPRRRLVGFEMVDRGIARHGYPVVDGSEEIGVVTSGTHSPTLKKAIGLAYLPLDKAAPGNEFAVLIRGKETRARVVPTPFYKRSR
jgi:aminomethyltransferase